MIPAVGWLLPPKPKARRLGAPRVKEREVCPDNRVVGDRFGKREVIEWTAEHRASAHGHRVAAVVLVGRRS